MLPLFPFHGLYIAALTRLPEYGSMLLALLLPAAGYYTLANLLPDFPRDLLGDVGRLALVGALYGSFKALVQDKPNRLPAYAGLALHSMVWWHLAATGSATPNAAVYTVSVALVTGGLLYALQRLQTRYGEIDPKRIGGLARPMPRFATGLGLLVMAAVGLPPFGLFSGFMTMLLHPSTVQAAGAPVGDQPLALSVAVSGELVVIFVVWFAASWYLFRMMQRLLFGPHRSDILYEDLRTSEVVSFVIMLTILLVLGLAPHGVFDASTFTNGYRTAMHWSP